VFIRVYSRLESLEMQSVMLVFSTHLCELLPFSPYGFMGLWASDRWTPAAKSLYRSIFIDDDILPCLLWFLSFYGTMCCWCIVSCRIFLLNCIVGNAYAEVNIYRSAEQIFSFSSAEIYKKKFNLPRLTNFAKFGKNLLLCRLWNSIFFLNYGE
jgi:hypothetical protein